MEKRHIFEIHSTSLNTKARTGTLTLPHGQVRTPVFMPIGTQGSVKSLSANELEQLGVDIILGNTYHLWQRPGTNVINEAGGLHSFSGWSKPILTDSGGFQAFSLSKIRTFTEEGVMFRSTIDGSPQFLSPEVSMQIQTILGSDIALVLDECLPAEVTEKQAWQAMMRTERWARRSKEEFEKLKTQTGHTNVLFGIPQGAQFNNLRSESAYMIMNIGFEGYSIGGVANGGEPEEIMYLQVDTQTSILEPHKPRHLLGVGTPRDIVRMVACGIDMFDCVYPTRNARHGSLFYRLDEHTYEMVHITNKRFETDFTPINPTSKFNELRTYTKAYLRHLTKAKELLAFRLMTLHNLEFYINLMDEIQTRISTNTFDIWYKQFREYT